jgi:ubiquitin-conjugating enzyme E2 Q
VPVEIEKHTCRILAGKEPYAFVFETAGCLVEPIYRAQLGSLALDLDGTGPDDDNDWQTGYIFLYERDPDDLDGEGRARALTELLDSLPSVLQLRSYLLTEPGRLLSSWRLLNRSALSLMCWIVSSNTSCIVQDSPVPCKVAQANCDGAATPSQDVAKAASNRISPLGNDWMQFRLAQGSPDKEFKFMKIIGELRSQPGSAKKALSLFAWHGSSIDNWHSIIRTGLDFQAIHHGRSRGHGVYFSSKMKVSLEYCGNARLHSTEVRSIPPWARFSCHFLLSILF